MRLSKQEIIISAGGSGLSFTDSSVKMGLCFALAYSLEVGVSDSGCCSEVETDDFQDQRKICY